MKDPGHEATERLSIQLEAAALRAIRDAWGEANGRYFDGRLRRPSFQLTDGEIRLGAWVAEERRLEIARRLLVHHGWGTVIEVLKHEMAHQYVDEVLGCPEETAHGSTFLRVCRERGIDESASGAAPTGDAVAPVLERVSKLLALAQSSNEHEAQAAMTAARRLMLKYNVDEATRSSTHSYSYRHLGKPSGRVSEAERILANILSDHFFVEVIWIPVYRPLEGKRGHVLEVTGSLENLEMAEYVHSFMTHTSARLWREHKRENGIRRDRDRRAYVAGVMAGFRDKLSEQAKKDAQVGLVWVGDAELEGYFKKRHPRIRWTRHESSRDSSAHQRGREAGRAIILHRGVGAGPSSGDRKLLKG